MRRFFVCIVRRIILDTILRLQYNFVKYNNNNNNKIFSLNKNYQLFTITEKFEFEFNSLNNFFFIYTTTQC